MREKLRPFLPIVSITLLITVPLILCLGTAGYLYFRWAGGTIGTRDNAMANLLDTTASSLFATLIGVFAGGAIALEANRWQERNQEKRAAAKKLEDERKRLAGLVDAIRMEIVWNREKVTALQLALDATNGVSRADLWAIASALVDAFSFGANDELIRQGLQTLLAELSYDLWYSLFVYYVNLRDLRNTVKLDATRHDFFLATSSAGPEQANKMLSEVQGLTNKVLQADAESTDILSREQPSKFKLDGPE